MKGCDLTKITITSTVLYMVSIACYFIYYQDYSYLSLWLGVVISFCAVILGILKGRETEKLLSVILFLITLQSLIILRTKPWGFTVATDASYSLQLSNSLTEEQKWTPGMGSQRESEYSYFPALHLWTTALSEISGLDSVLIARFIYPALSGSLVLVFYYIAIKSVLIAKVAAWATFILCLNHVFVFFDAYYLHESFGLIFYAMYLAAVFIVYFKKQKDRGLITVGMLASFLTVLSHHWSAYNLLTFSVVFLFLPGIYAYLLSLFHRTSPSKAYVPSIQFVLLACIIVLSWVLFISITIFGWHLEWGAEFLQSVLNPFSYEHPPVMTGYLFYERILMIFGTVVLVILGSSEFLIGVSKKEKSPKELVFDSWFAFSSAYILFFTYLCPIFFYTFDMSHRAWPFAFFGLAPLIAKNIVGKSRKRGKAIKSAMRLSFSKFKPILLIFPLISMVIQAPLQVHDPTYFLPDYSYYSTALWAKHHLSNETLVMDSQSETVLVPYGRVKFQLLERVVGNPRSNLVVYRSDNGIYVAPEKSRIIVFNKHVSEAYNWYPNVSADPSLLNERCNRMYDSGSLTIFFKP